MDKDIERLMKKSYLLLPKESIYYKALICSLDFWNAEDYYNNSNKAKIFIRVYMNKENKSLLRVSGECFIDERTLYRYRLDFVKIYKYFISNLKNEQIKNSINIKR